MKLHPTSPLLILLAATTLLPALTRPGIHWKNRWQPWDSPSLTAIAANPAGAMVAVGGNSIFHTTDGAIWSHARNRSGLAFQDVSWNGAEWVVVGLDGCIMTSPDALTWTHHSLGQIGHLSLGAVTSDPPVTVIPCNGVTAISIGADSWITTPNSLSIFHDTPHDLHLSTLPAVPGMFATVATGGGIYATIGGIDWTTAQPAEPNELFFAIGGNDSILVASAAAGGDTGTRFYTSTNGATWTRRFIPGLVAPFTDIIWTGSSFVACATDLASSSPVIFTSPDGITWSHHSPPGKINALCWNGSRLVGVGNYGARHYSADPAPDDPGDWAASPVSPVTGNVWGLASAEISATPWVVAVGENGLIHTSDNYGLSFTRLSSPTSAKLRDIIATDLAAHRFIAFGNELVVTSADAAIWTPQLGPDVPDANGGDWFTPTNYPTDPRLVVAVGSGGHIHTSPDGSTWTARSSGTTNDLHDVGSGWALGPKPGSAITKKLVAVGTAGTIVTSGGGGTWTNQTSGTTNTLRDVCGLDQGFIAVGDAGTVLRSINGTDWSPVTLPEPLDASENLFSCCWTGEHVIVTGTNLVLSSPDGINWSLQRCLVGTPYSLIQLDNGSSPTNGRLLGGGAGGIFSSDPSLDYPDWASFVGIPAGQDGPTDDPNGDGNDNLISYGFDIHPFATPSPESLAALPRLVSSTPGDPFRLRLAPGQYPGDLTYIVEASTTMAPGSWIEVMRHRSGHLRPTGDLHLSETEDADHIEIEFPERLGDHPAFFTRLRLELNP